MRSTQAPTHDAYIAALDEPRRSDVRMLHVVAELLREAVAHPPGELR